MRWSIRYQLLVPLLTLLLCVVVMSSWAAHASANQARKQMKQQVVRVIRTLRYSTFPLPQRVLELLKGFSGAEYVLVGKKDGLLTTMATPPEISRLNPADAENVELGERIVIDEIAYLYTGLELQRGPNRGDHVYIFYPEHAWRDALWEATWPSLLFGVFGGLVAIILTVLLSQRFTRRVQELESRTRLIAEGDFSPMTLPPSNDELRDLGLSINEMAGRLAEYQQAIQKNERLRLLGQLGGGLAHQLRNAVTGARLAVQLHDPECRQTTESREQGTGNREQRTGSREQGAE
ncbi:MAG: HAMP domain-containing protein, partial [Gemmataceae bacterium]